MQHGTEVSNLEDAAGCSNDQTAQRQARIISGNAGRLLPPPSKPRLYDELVIIEPAIKPYVAWQIIIFIYYCCMISYGLVLMSSFQGESKSGCSCFILLNLIPWLLELMVIVSLFKWEKPKEKVREENWSNLCYVLLVCFSQTLLPLLALRSFNWYQSNLCSKVSKERLDSLLTL